MRVFGLEQLDLALTLEVSFELVLLLPTRRIDDTDDEYVGRSSRLSHEAVFLAY